MHSSVSKSVTYTVQKTKTNKKALTTSKTRMQSDQISDFDAMEVSTSSTDKQRNQLDDFPKLIAIGPGVRL